LSIHRPLCPEEIALGYTLTRGLYGVETRFGRCRKQIRPLPMTGIEPRDLGRPVRSVITSFPFLRIVFISLFSLFISRLIIILYISRLIILLFISRLIILLFISRLIIILFISRLIILFISRLTNMVFRDGMNQILVGVNSNPMAVLVQFKVGT
jgi:hypothetical protein